MSPTQRTVAHLRELGYLPAIVEKWNPHARIRQDLWGWCDVLAVREGEVLAVQCTAAGVAARVRKIAESETVAVVRKAGVRIEVHGWTKRANGRYALRVEDLS
jgi:hypothetical protein